MKIQWFDTYIFRLVTDLKNPKNFAKYIKGEAEFIRQMKDQFRVVNPLRYEIKQIQRQMRSGALKLAAQVRGSPTGQSSNCRTDDWEIPRIKKTLVIEPENLIFTIKTEKLENVDPNLVYEEADSDGNPQLNYMYLTQSYQPFLKYIWEHFEVVVYSRLRSSLLTQLLGQIESMVPGVTFPTVFGSGSCLKTKLYREQAPQEGSFEEVTVGMNQQESQYFDVKLKNVERIFKKRGKDNVIILDNEMYSYIHCLQNFIPVPMFLGKENSWLFFLKFWLEDNIDEVASIWPHICSDIA